MAEAVADPRRREVRWGLVSTTLTTLAQGAQWLLLVLLFSILTEWVGMVFWWPEEGLQHSRSMLEAEIGYLGSDFRRSVVTSSPAEFAKTVADKTYYALFEFTGVADFIAWLSAPPALYEEGLRSRLHSLYQPIAESVIAAMQVTQVFSVRLAILTLAMPVFVLFSLVALIDGFVKRDLRRWGGGRESSFVYHWAKRSAMPLLILCWVIYLALPFSLRPDLHRVAVCIAVRAQLFCYGQHFQEVLVGDPLQFVNLSRSTTSQGCDHVAVFGWQGSQFGCRRAAVCAPPPGAHPPLSTCRGILPGVQSAPGGGGQGFAGACRAGVRGVPQMRPSRAWLSARPLR